MGCIWWLPQHGRCLRVEHHLPASVLGLALGLALVSGPDKHAHEIEATPKIVLPPRAGRRLRGGLAAVRVSFLGVFLRLAQQPGSFAILLAILSATWGKLIETAAQSRRFSPLGPRGSCGAVHSGSASISG